MRTRSFSKTNLWERFGWIVGEVAKRHRMTVSDILSKSPNRRIGRARRDAYSCLYASGLSYPEVGLMFGRDHTTVLYGVRRDLEGVREAG